MTSVLLNKKITDNIQNEINKNTKNNYLNNCYEAYKNKMRSFSSDPFNQKSQDNNKNITSIKKTRRNLATINYITNNQPKKELNHIVHIPLKTHLIHDKEIVNNSCFPYSYRKNLENIIINKNKINRKRHIIDKYHNLSQVGDLMRNYSNYSSNENSFYEYSRTRRNIHNPIEQKDLLDEIPYKFRKNMSTKEIIKRILPLENEKKRLFPDRENNFEQLKKKLDCIKNDDNKENINEQNLILNNNYNNNKVIKVNINKNLNNKNNKHKKSNSSNLMVKIYQPKDANFKANKDNVNYIFNSKENKKIPEQKLTIKVTKDDFHKFAKISNINYIEHQKKLNQKI